MVVVSRSEPYIHLASDGADAIRHPRRASTSVYGQVIVYFPVSDVLGAKSQEQPGTVRSEARSRRRATKTSLSRSLYRLLTISLPLTP